jgi:c-di-GMP-binding flagellar brake protein YcgR
MTRRVPNDTDLSPSPLSGLTPGRIILVEFEGLCGRYPCPLTEVTREGEWVVRVPQSVTTRHPLRAGDTVVVRCAHEGTLYGFRTQVKAHAFRPQASMTLARPTEIGMQRLRQDDRVPVLIPATACIGDQQLSGMLIDLSRGGCRFNSETAVDAPAAIPAGSGITLRFPLFQMGEQQTASGSVRSANVQDGALRIGIEFGELSASVSACVEAYIAGLIDLVDEEAA